MRKNATGLALSIGMALIVLLMGFAVLSAVGLVGFAADEGFAQTEQATPANGGPVVPVASKATPPRPVPAAEAAAIAAGDALFKNNCTQCHAVNEKVVGPALAGILKRRTIGWLVPWVQNSTKVIASGDEYAGKLFSDNAKQQMPSFPQLMEKDIRSIMAYVSQQEGSAATAGVTVAVVEYSSHSK